jgi:hypothetical protein
MSDELKFAKKIIKEVLIDLMVKKVMSASIQASSMRGVQASPSTTHGSSPSRVVIENRTKHRYDLTNLKLIPTIFLDYILPLANVVSRDSVSRDFEYTIVTAYLSKGIRVVQAQQDKITTLKFNEFNLGDRKNHSILTLYKYLTRTKRKNSKIIPQPWTMKLA